MESLSGVGMDLDPDAFSPIGETNPQLVQPRAVHVETTGVGPMLGVNHAGDLAGGLPRARPQHLAFTQAAAATAEMPEGLAQHPLRNEERHDQPPFTALGRSRSRSLALMPAWSTVSASLNSVPA